MISRDDAREELRRLFPTLATGDKSGYLEDYATIASVLSSKEELRAPLTGLEHQLAQAQAAQLKRELDSLESSASKQWEKSNFWNAFVAYVSSVGPLKQTGGLSKILTHELENFERNNGFQLGAKTGKADVLIGAAGWEFNVQLKQGRPFKDVGAGKDHGESSHRIQWYLVGTSGKLTLRPVDLYREIANHKGQLDGKPVFLWMWLCDRNPPGFTVAGNPFNSPDMWDWRAPESLNWALTRDDEMKTSFPVLSAVLVRRYGKRTDESTAEYFRRKIPAEVFEEFEAKNAELKMKGIKPKGALYYKR